MVPKRRGDLDSVLTEKSASHFRGENSLFLFPPSTLWGQVLTEFVQGQSNIYLRLISGELGTRARDCSLPSGKLESRTFLGTRTKKSTQGERDDIDLRSRD